MRVAQKIDAKGLIMDNHEAQAELFARKGQPDLALGAYRQFHHLSTEIFNAEAAQKSEEIRARYESERHRLEMENLVAQSGRERLFLLAILIAVLAAGFLALNRYRLRARANSIIEAKNRELEAIDRIVKVINREVDINSLLRSLLNEVRALLPQADRGGFLLRDKHHPQYVLRMTFGGDIAAAEGGVFDETAVRMRYMDTARELLDGIFVSRDAGAIHSLDTGRQLPAARSTVAVRVAVERAPEGLIFFSRPAERRHLARRTH